MFKYQHPHNHSLTSLTSTELIVHRLVLSLQLINFLLECLQVNRRFDVLTSTSFLSCLQFSIQCLLHFFVLFLHDGLVGHRVVLLLQDVLHTVQLVFKFRFLVLELADLLV